MSSQQSAILHGSRCSTYSRVSHRLEPDGEGARLDFEHLGFDVSLRWGDQSGWTKIVK